MEGSWLILATGGLFAGVLSGILGIGGGFIIVSLLSTLLGYPFARAIATSSIVIVMNSGAGSFYNWRKGYLNLRRLIYIAIPAAMFGPVGAYTTGIVPEYILLAIFASFMLVNIGLIRLKKSLAARQHNSSTKNSNSIFARVFVGAIAGFFSGLLGIGGGAIMVPLQMLLLNEEIKVAVRTSLGVIVIANISTCIFHLYEGNVLFIPTLILGISGAIGSQLGTRLLPNLPNSLVSKIFIGFLCIMALLNFREAWIRYQSLV